jgi:ABC-type polysaccharide/polyol phosphate transport system ATPase subunit
MKPAIKITNLSKTFKIPTEKHNSLRERFAKLKFKSEYKPLHILKNINLKVRKGEWLGIIGKNGSGKSTLLKLISDIYEADRGTIETDGRITPFLELGVGFNPELTAEDNIFLNGTILGMTRKKIKKQFNQIVNFAGVKRFINLKLKNFSSGMHVRLGFSIAIQAAGDIYLLDEVLAVGDYEFQQKTKKVFANMKKAGKTVIFVSHDLDSIKANCHRAIWLDQGRIVEQGNPKQVVDKYIKA